MGGGGGGGGCMKGGGASGAGDAGGARVRVTEGQVVEECTVADDEGGAHLIKAATALAVARNVDGLVVGQDRVDDSQAAGIVDAGPLSGPAVSDRQAGDRHRRPAPADVKDPAGVVAADGQLVRAWAVDVQALVDQQLPAG